MSIENLKAAIAAKLKENEGKQDPKAHLTTSVFSNSNNIKTPEKNPFSIVPDVIISGKMPEMPKDVLAPSNIHDEKARNEMMARWKIEDPARYKVEYAKEQHLEAMKKLSKGYADAQKAKDDRRKL